MDLDRSGNVAQFTRVYLGPSLGWAMLPIIPETFVITGPSYNVQPVDSRILLNSITTPVTSVQLPDVVSWQKSGSPILSAFERSLWIKDYAYKATANNIAVLPMGGQTIDGLSQFTIVTDGLLIRLYPLSDLTGWFVG